LIANAAFTSESIGSFGTTGSTQTVNLSGNPIVPFTPQDINFATPTPVTWSTSIPPVQLVATGGGTGNPVVFSIVSGQGTLSGPNNSILTVKNIGTTVVAANQAGGLANGVYYAAATQVTQPVVVNPIGIVATPTFSVPAGTYNAVQSVTISESTPGATVYYTTNGNTPTTSSPVYTGGTISVGVTTTIKAIAVETGYTTSAVASATYTLPPDFVLNTYVTHLDIPNGLGGSTTISLAPLYGFTGKVTPSCSGLSSGVTCSFLDGSGNPTSTLTIKDTTTVYGTVIVQVNQTASLDHREKRPFAPAVPVMAVALFFGFRKRKRLAIVMVLMLGAIGASMITGCGSTSTTGKTNSSTFTLTTTSGSVTHSQTITLVVNNL
jgi:hypothetical protein